MVTVLTLAVIAVLAAFADRSTRLALGLLRLLGGVLCGLTLVIVASALTRLGLYAGAYGFTVPRLLGYAIEVWLGVILVLILLAGVRLRAGWLPRGAAAAGVAVLIALAAVNPDALIARTVLHRLDGPYGVDFGYLSTRSADAVDEIVGVQSNRVACALWLLDSDLKEPDPWYATNLSRAHARTVLAGKGKALTCQRSDG